MLEYIENELSFLQNSLRRIWLIELFSTYTIRGKHFMELASTIPKEGGGGNRSHSRAMCMMNGSESINTHEFSYEMRR